MTWVFAVAAVLIFSTALTLAAYCLMTGKPIWVKEPWLSLLVALGARRADTREGSRMSLLDAIEGRWGDETEDERFDRVDRRYDKIEIFLLGALVGTVLTGLVAVLLS